METAEHRRYTPDGFRMIRSLSKLLLYYCLVSSPAALAAGPTLPPDISGKLLAELVRASLEYDVYNARCRGNTASTKTNDSNRLLLRKYRLTVNQVINHYLGTDDRQVKTDIGNQVLEKIAELGGCRAAKQGGLLKTLDLNYRQLFQQVADLP